MNELHAEAFEHAVLDDDWLGQVTRHSLGRVCAQTGGAAAGVGTALVRLAIEQARAAGCEWLHADFDDHLRAFYLDACGFTPTPAGLVGLRRGT